jgi:hypothetical protein
LSTDEVVVNVSDSKPPHIAVTLSQNLLWPPNNQMVNITATVTADDACSDPTVSLVSISSSVPDGTSHLAGGSTESIAGADLGTPDYSFQLKAWRPGWGHGQVYTVTYSATDAAGNSSTAVAQVLVPHSRNRKGQQQQSAIAPSP